MVRDHDWNHRIGKFHAVQNLSADYRMNFHLFEFDGREPPRLRNDVLRDRQLANVMQQRGRLQRLKFRLSKAQFLCNFLRINPYPPKVIVGIEVFCFDGQR